MRLLENTKIGVKIASVVALLAVVGIGSAFFARSQLLSIDAAYSDMIEKNAKASILMARADRDLNRIGYAAYRVVVYDGNSEQARNSAAVVEKTERETTAFYDEVIRLVPEKAGEIAELKKTAHEAFRLVDEGIRAGLQNDMSTSKARLESADKILVAVSTNNAEVNNAMIESVDLRSAELTDLSISTGWVVAGATTIASVATFALALFVAAKGITGPLDRLRRRMDDLAAGRLDADVEGRSRRDEVGQMARTVLVFKENAERTLVLEAEAAEARRQAETEAGRTEAMRRKTEADQQFVVASLADGLAKVAEGDLTMRLDKTFPDDYRQLQSDFNAAVAKLKETMTTVRSSVQGMKSQTDEISQASDDMSRRTEQQAAALEETAAALNEITLAVRQTADSARQAADVTDAARLGAEKSGAIVRKAVDAMGHIEQSSDKIGKIIGVIDEIAFQTNLLALNAGVEAARAGEAGRGFAVVAQEVRGLAQRSAEAAKEIKELISASSQQVGQGVDLVGQTGSALEKMVEQVAELTALVTGIASSAKEQATGLHEVNAAVNQMDQVTQQNAAMVEQSTAANRALAGEADELMGLMSQFRTGEPTNVRRLAPAANRTKPRPAAPASAPRAHSGGAATARKLDVAQSTDEWAEF